ncbi:type 1 glutamine amidotransferase domain-containing protein [Lujinxingia vulgaris]|uniref:Type 1 glutamine amidotransferase domain-containing protein n=1 Tax=Lujinxingia vulgaris TaxID=2600176 RepID=A0A5C6XIQ3_9DELT|nr:type 1 glutamine amidotransferase domain-containing protein [Lujinxingia vulgaris]TXD37142.1 type 1 glutamine amidotransferase domain-containing protein [Lujinxingia vulgaris]
MLSSTRSASLFVVLATGALLTACATGSPENSGSQSLSEDTAPSPANDALPEDTPSSEGNVLFVLTNHTSLGDTDTQTGYYLSEVTHPWSVLTEAGYTVDFASPQGGPVTPDPKSLDLDDPINAQFWENDALREKLDTTISIERVDPKRYQAIFFAGGHGTMWDFADNADMQRVTRDVWEAGGAVAAVCHGPAALLNVKLSDGQWLVASRDVTGFTDAEERAVELDQVVPFMLESQLRERGANFDGADNFQENVVVDGRLITGQNPASATGVGEAMVRALDAANE